MKLANFFSGKQARRAKRNRKKPSKAQPQRRTMIFEPLEPRVLLSADPRLIPVAVLDPVASIESPVVPDLTSPTVVETATAEPLATVAAPATDLPPLQLVDPDTGALAGQVFFLDLDGASGVTYDGPVRVEGIDVPSFQAPEPFVGEELNIIEAVIADLNRGFDDLGVTFTDVQPNSATEYSTVYVGGDDAAFSQYGSFYGLAEKADIGNQDHTGEAFVFSDLFQSIGRRRS